MKNKKRKRTNRRRERERERNRRKRIDWGKSIKVKRIVKFALWGNNKSAIIRWNILGGFRVWCISCENLNSFSFLLLVLLLHSFLRMKINLKFSFRFIFVLFFSLVLFIAHIRLVKFSHWYVSTSRSFGWPLLILLLYRFLFFIVHGKWTKRKSQIKNLSYLMFMLCACVFTVVNVFVSQTMLTLTWLEMVIALFFFLFHYYVMHSSWLAILHQQFSAVNDGCHGAQWICFL